MNDRQETAPLALAERYYSKLSSPLKNRLLEFRSTHRPQQIDCGGGAGPTTWAGVAMRPSFCCPAVLESLSRSSIACWNEKVTFASWRFHTHASARCAQLSMPSLPPFSARARRSAIYWAPRSAARLRRLSCATGPANWTRWFWETPARRTRCTARSWKDSFRSCVYSTSVSFLLIKLSA